MLHARLHNAGMDARGRLKLVIDEKGLSARGVSLAAGLSDSMVHKFLTGQTRSMTVDNLEKIAKALGVSFRYLMFGDAEYENVVYIWDHIPERDRKKALRILEEFADIPVSDAG